MNNARKATTSIENQCKAEKNQDNQEGPSKNGWKALNHGK
jgi:hypothetical protein